MKKKIFFAVIVFSSLYAALCYEPPIVKIKQGLLRGAEEITVIGDKTYSSFKGIPYAEPPLGELRFKAPRPPKPWRNIRDATEIKEGCIYRPEQFRDIVGSEDCLYLNVYTPKLTFKSEDEYNSEETKNNNNATLLSVIVLFSDDAMHYLVGKIKQGYGPDFLVSKDVILVTCDYRVGIMGYLNLNIKEVSGNAGLKDQVAVLKWIQQNIEVFGGNPKSVTLLGHGSYATLHIFLHNISPMSTGLFHRIMPIGAEVILDRVHSDAKSNAKNSSLHYKFLEDLGYDTTNIKTLLDHLPNIPCNELLSEPTTEIFQPITEDNLGQDMFLSKKSNKIFHHVDMMIGYCNMATLELFREKESWGDMIYQDFIDFYNSFESDKLPKRYCPDEFYPRKQDLCRSVINYYTGGKATMDNIKDVMRQLSFSYFTRSAIINARIWSKKGRTYLFKFSTYLFEMNYVGSYSVDYGVVGASDSDILSYIFFPGPTKHIPQNGTPEYKIVNLLTTALTNFAKYGEPSPDCMMGVEWLKFDKKLRAYAEFADDIYIFSFLDDDETAFWQELYKKAKIEF